MPAPAFTLSASWAPVPILRREAPVIDPAYLLRKSCPGVGGHRTGTGEVTEESQVT